MTPRLAYLAAIPLAAFACFGACRENAAVGGEVRSTTRHQAARKLLGRWAAAELPRDRLVLSSDIGAVAYYAPDHQFLDLVGLTSGAPYQTAAGNTWPEFQQWLVSQGTSYLLDSQNPDGSIHALRVLNEPATNFRGIKRTAKVEFRSELLHMEPALPLRFVAQRLVWTGVKGVPAP